MRARPCAKLIRATLLQREIDLEVVGTAALRLNSRSVSQLTTVDDCRSFDYYPAYLSRLVRIFRFLDALAIRQNPAIRRNLTAAVERGDRFLLSCVSRRGRRTWR